MKKKRWIGILLSLVLGVCTACGGGAEPAVPALDYGEIEIPEAVTAESEDMTNTENDGPQLYQSSLSQEKVIAGYNVMDYGAKADGVSDDAAALQSAINAAEVAGGGVVYMPAGKYLIGAQIDLRKGVSVYGEWIPADQEGFEDGTTLLVGTGKNNLSAQAADAFIRMYEGSKLSRVNIYYPDQNAASPEVYPYTIANGEYLGYTVECVNIINAYRGILVAQHNVVMLDNIYMSVISEGFYSDAIYDIPRYMNIHVSADVWADYEAATQGKNSEADIRNAVAGATAFRFGKIDWAYLYNICISDVNIGVRFETSTYAVGAFNGQFNAMNVSDVNYCFSVAELATIGAIVSSADLSAKISAVTTEEDFKYPAQIFFNNSQFSSGEVTVCNEGDGALLFTECTFREWGECVFDNVTMGYINADSCDFEQESSLIAHMGPDVVGSMFVNCTFAVYPTMYNESASSEIYIKDLNYEEPIEAFAATQNFDRPARSAATDKIYYASDFGAVADGSLSDNSAATDNTAAIQQALNCAGANGGGIVYLGAGNYFVKEYLVIPSGVELKGVSENNRHFGIKARGTTLVTEHGKNEEMGKPFVSLHDRAGLTGLNIFYPDQHYSDNVVYSPTVFVGGDDSYLYNVTIPNAYLGVLVKGKNVHIDWLRTLGLKACLVLEGADNAFVENVMFTGGDWQDGQRAENAPPTDHWTNFPNYHNEGIYISNSDGVVLFECFTFGMGHGLHLEGEVNDLLAVGMGVDCSSDAVVLENTGKNNVLINSQLVGIDNYVRSTSKFSGEVSLYATLCWCGSSNVRCTFDGEGVVRMQQCKISNGGVDVNTATVRLQNFVFDLNLYPMVVISPEAEGYLINSLGTINLLKTEGESASFTTANLGVR